MADEVVDEVQSSELLIRMARICDEALSNRVAAMECWERLLLKQPGHPEALEVLAPFYESQGRWSDLVDVLEAKLEPDTETYASNLVRCACLLPDLQHGAVLSSRGRTAAGAGDGVPCSAHTGRHHARTRARARSCATCPTCTLCKCEQWWRHTLGLMPDEHFSLGRDQSAR